MTIEWPRRTLVPQDIAFNLRYKTRSGGMALSGQEQVIASSSTHWEAQMSLRLNRPPLVLAYRALINSLDGRLGKVLVPTYSGFYAITGQTGPHTFDYRYIGVQLGPFGDTSTFGDSSEFEQPGVRALTSGAALKGATIFNITMSADNILPLQGSYFSIGEFLYSIISFTLISGRDFTVEVRPPLRLGHPSGALVDLSIPKCRMKLASDDSGSLSLSSLRFGTPTLNFIEDTPASGETVPVFTGEL